METKIQSIRFDATEELQAFIKDRQVGKSHSKISKKVEVQLKVVKPGPALNKETSITVTVPGTTLFVEKLATHSREGVDLCVDALRVQLEKYKGKTAQSLKNIGKIFGD